VSGKQIPSIKIKWFFYFLLSVKIMTTEEEWEQKISKAFFGIHGITSFTLSILLITLLTPY
jgi:hypothetical protein